MASLEIAEKKTLKWEGGYCNVAGDRGGETIFGIARNFHPQCKIWKIVDDYKRGFESFGKKDYKELETLCLGNAEFNEHKDNLYRELYWDKIKGDSINSQDVANALYDWAVNSGASVAVKNIQRVINAYGEGTQIAEDGILGNATLAEINKLDGKKLCNALCDKRKQFFEAVAQKGQNAKFLKGWLNRVNDFYV